MGILMSVWAVQAAGLGKLTVSSYLGQPLNAEIALESVTDKEVGTLSAKLASPKISHQAGVHLAPYHATLSVAVEKRTNGRPYIRITSSQAISEPFLKLLIELHSSSGQMLREYNVLLDPAETQKPVASKKDAAADSKTQVSAKVEKQLSVSQGKTATQASNIYGPVIQGDTLSRIARQISPDSVNLNQMLVALYRANRDAFLEKNMNLLKVGVILRIPDENEISSITAKEASREMLVQRESWGGYRQKIADLADGAPERDKLKQSQTGKITAVSEDSAVAGSGKSEEVLILSKGELLNDSHSSDKSVEGKTAQNYLHMMEEDAIAKERALHEANERVAILEQNVAKLQRLLELKDKASGSKAQVEDHSQHMSDLQPAPVTAEQAGVTAETAKSAIQATEKSVLPVTIPVQPVAPVSSIKPLQPVTPAPEGSPLMDTLIGFAEENSELVAGGLAALLVTILGISVIRRRKAQTEDLDADEDLGDYNREDIDPVKPAITETISPDSESMAKFDQQVATAAVVAEGFSPAGDHANIDSGLFLGNMQDEKTTGDSFFDADLPNQTQEEGNLTFDELNEPDYEIKISTTEPGQTEYVIEAAAEAERNDKNDIGEQWIFTVSDTGLESKSDSVQNQESSDESVSSNDEQQINFDLNLPVDAGAIQESREGSDLSDLSASLADIDLDLGEEKDMKPQSGSEDAEAGEMQWQEVATKLDLARAYLEMDDKEGAREILEEVLREGDDEQQATARSMLDQAG